MQTMINLTFFGEEANGKGGIYAHSEKKEETKSCLIQAFANLSQRVDKSRLCDKVSASS